MEWGIDIFSYGGTVLYVLAALMAVLYLHGGVPAPWAGPWA